MKDKPKSNVSIPVSQIQKLAHAGTKEALDKLYKMREQDLDDETDGNVYIAIEECKFIYYSPTNESEEKDFELAIFINERQKLVDKLEREVMEDDAREKIDDIDREIHKKVLKNNPNDVESWGNRVYLEKLPDFYIFENRRKDDLRYQKAWIIEAKKMIRHDKYKNVPSSHLDSFDILGMPEYCDDEYDGECRCPDCINEGGCCDESCPCGCDSKLK